MIETYEICGTSSDGRESRYITTVPTHQDAFEFLDGRGNCVEAPATWSADRMSYGAYTIRVQKVSAKEHDKLCKGYARFKELTKNFTREDLKSIALFNR